MRDAVIVAAVRTPVGKRNGALAGVHPVDLSAHVLQRARRARGPGRPGRGRRRDLGLRQPGRRADLRYRPQRRARRRLAAVGAGRDRGPAVRVKPAVGPLRRRGPGQRPVRRGGGGRRRVDEPGPDGLLDRPGPGEPVRLRACRPSSGGCRPNQGIGAEMIAERWGQSRAQLDEYSLASHAEGGRRHRRGPLRRADHPGQAGRRHGRRHRRGRPPRRHARGPRQAQARVQAGRRDPRGQQLADQRRRRRAADDDEREGGRARPHPGRPGAHRRARRRRPGHHADRADSRHPEGAEQERPAARRHRRLRGQRGVRARSRSPGWPKSAPTRQGSTPTAARSPSATPSAAAAPAS